MALRTIYTLENPVLRAKAKKITRFDDHLERLAEDMFDTMRAAPGVGLAAPQIGLSIRVLVAEYEEESVALVNPEIIKASADEELGTEGCLSIPGVVGDDVPRATAVTVKAKDLKGKEIRLKADGWFARILQHEIDHLDGVLFIDRIAPEKVRPLRPDEIADEAEVHHEPAGEMMAGASVPTKSANSSAKAREKRASLPASERSGGRG
ncbi:MAG: peptide deformylase [Ktedonobacterales bacterium]